MITPYGYKTLGQVLLISFVLFGLSYFLHPIIAVILSALGVFLIVFTLQFFRDPNRTPPAKDNIIISPADGKVVVIQDIEHHKFFNGPAKQVSVFMSPLNVHVNRIPITGTVTHVKYIPGEYIVAFDHSCGERNERTEIGIENRKTRVFFKQISGYVARRIVCDLKDKQQVKIGERFGMIRFGSRVDIFMPPTVKIMVKEGDKASAGETIVAEY